MKKYIKAADGSYQISELEQDDIQKALGFTRLKNGLYAGTIGNLLVIWEDGYDTYTVYDGGVEYMDEIIDAYLYPNSGLTQEDIKNEFGVNIREYRYFEEI